VRADGAAVGIIGKDAGRFMNNVTISDYTGVGILRAWTSPEAGMMLPPDTNLLDPALANKVEAGPCGMTSPVAPGGGCVGAASTSCL
jgi:hypothetical protein